MALKLVDRPHPEWTIAAANNTMLHRKEKHVAAQALAECPALSGSWKTTLSRPTEGPH
ncbi:MAG: 3-alpha domain-containing protein [Candidatus Nitrotoga sp.]